MKRLVLFSCIAMIAAFLLPGCGTTTGEPSSSKMLASQECIGCHSTSTSHVTGLSIVSEWTASAHNTGDGASCADCHEPAAGHPNNCSRCHGGGAPTGTADHDVRLNPDVDGTCTRKCHGLNFPNDVMVRLAPQHFGNMTATTDRSKRASYVSTMYIGACRKCHNPHNPTGHIKESRDWANSGHANPTSSARSTDFKTRGTFEPANTTYQNNYCVRCHTSTGYINFVTSGFMNLSPFGNPVVQNGLPGQTATVSPDDTKELTNCDVCHDDGQGSAYSFKVRTVPPVTIYYNISTSRGSVKMNGADSRVDYSDLGPSNVCVPCHSGGRSGVGKMITLAASRFANFSSLSNLAGAHQLPPVLTLLQKGPYEFSDRNYSNPAFLHSSVGLGNTLGTGTSGPCVTCHMNTPNPHFFSPVTLDPGTTTSSGTGTVLSITSRACAHCHNGTSVTGQLLVPMTVAELNAKKKGFQAAVTILNALVATSGVINSTNWARYGKAGGPNTMGASYNNSLLKVEDGAYVHNDLYTRRLIYDSIDWLYNGKLDNDVAAAIDDTNKVKLPAGTKNAITGAVYSSGDLANLRDTAKNYIFGSGNTRP